jgi:hypothetical protein
MKERILFLDEGEDPFLDEGEDFLQNPNLLAYLVIL